MKAIKLAGIRLINYINDGINWKDHKDIVLDFWKNYKCRDSGYNPKMFENMFIFEELPTKIQEIYEIWFNGYDFQNEDDSDWIDFVNGTLNIFYHTANPTLMEDGTWYVELMKAELKAREIVEEQVFHGNPNINSFWKLDTNTKPEEVGGRKNGFLFTRRLTDIQPRETRGYYWAVAFQCPDSVKLFYQDKKEMKSKIINWAANCKNITLLKVTKTGRFIIDPVFVEGKAGRPDKNIPEGMIPRTPLTGHGITQYCDKNYEVMYGVNERIEEAYKQLKEEKNKRRSAINVMNDEEVKISRLISNVYGFIDDGNVSPERRARNKQIRETIKEKNKLREREIKAKLREILKDKKKKEIRQRNKLNPLFKKK